MFFWVWAAAMLAALAAGAAASSRLTGRTLRLAVNGAFAALLLALSGVASWKLIDGLDRSTRAQALRAQAPAGNWGVPSVRWVEDTDGTKVWPVIAGEVELIIAAGSWHGVRAHDRYLRRPGGLVRCDTAEVCVRMARHAARELRQRR